MARYKQLEHDMILWHFVKDRRRQQLESPIDARDWLLTIDYRLQAFDQAYVRKNRSRVPVCIDPASLVQMLQLWVPRTESIEQAMMAGIRLPFLFQEFDGGASAVSLAILKQLSKFQDRDDIPPESIERIVLNEAVRANISRPNGNAAEDFDLVREALIGELTRREREEKDRAGVNAERAEQLEGILHQKDRDLLLAAEDRRAIANQAEERRSQLERTTQQLNEGAARILALERAIEEERTSRQRDAESKAQDERQRKRQRDIWRFSGWSCGLTIAAIALSIVVANTHPWVRGLVTNWFIGLGLFSLCEVVAIWFIQTRPCVTDDVRGTRAFAWIHRLMGPWAKFLLLVCVVGVLVNLVSSRIDREQTPTPTQGSTVPSALER